MALNIRSVFDQIPFLPFVCSQIFLQFTEFHSVCLPVIFCTTSDKSIGFSFVLFLWQCCVCGALNFKRLAQILWLSVHHINRIKIHQKPNCKFVYQSGWPVSMAITDIRIQLFASRSNTLCSNRTKSTVCSKYKPFTKYKFQRKFIICVSSLTS